MLNGGMICLSLFRIVFNIECLVSIDSLVSIVLLVIDSLVSRALCSCVSQFVMRCFHCRT